MTSPVVFALGSCFKTSCLSNENIMHTLNPEARLWEFKCFINLLEKTVSERLSAHLNSLCHTSNISHHSICVGLNTATSDGWQMCVKFGAKQIKKMLFWEQYCNYLDEKWEPRLHIIKTNSHINQLWMEQTVWKTMFQM